MAARRKNEVLQERIVLAYDHGEVTADTTIKLYKCKRKFRVESVDYINVTGLAQDATNYFVISLKKGSTVMASWSTLTGAQGSIAADTFVSAVLSATEANKVAAVDDVLSLSLDETGTATLPAGRIVIHGRYI